MVNWPIAVGPISGLRYMGFFFFKGVPELGLVYFKGRSIRKRRGIKPAEVG